ncbi:hypothetical protein V494_06248 [Pseudogymnoascus sp. VKM F-4513 (FW-928)]|nr:hypothetical protein V494_06248 [Pseudogymnoascus sp. VKM F-4513 (FW-928)]
MYSYSNPLTVENGSHPLQVGRGSPYYEFKLNTKFFTGMASNITFNEAIAGLTAMREYLRTSNLPVKAIQVEGTIVTMDAEDISMVQRQSRNDTVDLFALGLELKKMIYTTSTTQLKALTCKLDELSKLSLTAKAPQGLAGLNAGSGAGQNSDDSLETGNYYAWIKLATEAAEAVGNVLHCMKGGQTPKAAKSILLAIFTFFDFSKHHKATATKAWYYADIHHGLWRAASIQLFRLFFPLIYQSIAERMLSWGGTRWKFVTVDRQTHYTNFFEILFL